MRKKVTVKASTGHYGKNAKKSPVSGQLILLLVLIALVVFVAVFSEDILLSAEQKAYPQKYSLYVNKYAEKYEVPQYMVYAVIRTESGFDSSAVSAVGAIGLMQLMPDTFRWISDDLLRERLASSMAYDPETNIRYGTYLLKRLYDRYGDWNAALAAYNAGPGRVDDWLKDAQYTDSSGHLIPDRIPIAETRNYVNKVQSTAQVYTRLYPKLSR